MESVILSHVSVQRVICLTDSQANDYSVSTWCEKYPAVKRETIVKSEDAYAAGLTALQGAWESPGAETSDIPAETKSAIATVMGEDSQVAQRYALLTQLLLKQVLGITDSLSLVDFGEDNFTARSFAKYTTAKFGPITNRIGNSGDPYVSNPLRQPRLSDSLLSGRGRREWGQLFNVLMAVDANPQNAPVFLAHALNLIRDRPAVAPGGKVVPQAPPVHADLQSLESHTSLSEDELLDMLEVLESDQPQVILAGPPGTSKTHTAQALAAFLTDGDSDRVTVTQLHATYGYEDFVEGLRPDLDESGVLRFEVVPGALRRVAESVEGGVRRVLILDELNRANLPRVFGELLFAIERRGEPIDLMHTQGFTLPPELVFIGTMNTADRSIRNLDAAIRRRFQIFELPPSYTVLQSFYESRLNEIPDLAQGLSDLNDRLIQLLDRHHTVGHAFLMDERGMTSGRLNQVWTRQIRPLLEEYLFDMPDELSQLTVETFWPTATS